MQPVIQVSPVTYIEKKLSHHLKLSVLSKICIPRKIYLIFSTDVKFYGVVLSHYLQKSTKIFEFGRW